MFACSPAPIRRRFLDAVIALGCMIVSAGWWVLLTVIVPSGERPYIGGSQTDSFLELTFSYNGLGRLTGNETGSVVPGSTGGSAQSGMWGETGIFRLFSSGFNDQITWLALLAFAGIVVGIIAALALKRRHRESRATVTAIPFHMPHSTFGSNLDYAFSLENATEVLHRGAGTRSCSVDRCLSAIALGTTTPRRRQSNLRHSDCDQRGMGLCAGATIWLADMACLCDRDRWHGLCGIGSYLRIARPR